MPHVKEVQDLISTVRESKRVVQVGSQTTSADQWWKAKKAIADGMIGKMIMSQGSYHRNSFEGEWNYDIDAAAGPDATGDDHIDWNMWLGPAPKRPWTRTGSSGSGSIGIIQAVLQPTCSSMWWHH